MPTVDFTQEELKNLRVFLNRVRLTVAEVPAVIPIMAKITRAETEPQEVKSERRAKSPK